MNRSGALPRLKVSAFVKAKKMTKAILDVQFVSRAGENKHQWAAYVGAKENGDPPVTHDWKRYEGIVEIPDQTQKIIVAAQIYGPGDVWIDDITADYTTEKVTDPQASNPPAVSPVPPDADVADVAFEERRAGNAPRKRYLLIEPSAAPTAPEQGHRLLLVLPGGDGGTGFQTFARRIAKNALPPGYLLAELVAVSWTPEQAQQIVWPTAADKLPDAGFTTEQFVDDVKTCSARTPWPSRLPGPCGQVERQCNSRATMVGTAGAGPCTTTSAQDCLARRPPTRPLMETLAGRLGTARTLSPSHFLLPRCGKTGLIRPGFKEACNRAWRDRCSPGAREPRHVD